MCYLKNYHDIGVIVAEFKKLEGARYPKKIHWMTQGLKDDKNCFYNIEIRLDSRPYRKNQVD